MLLDLYDIIDLTHPLSPKAPTWNGSCGFCLSIKKDYDEMFRVQKITLHAGVGTHIDAPSHCVPGGIDVSKIPLTNLIAQACVIDVSQKAHADYVISAEDIFEYEKKQGRIPQKALVIGYTGWGRFWDFPDQYRNVDLQGQMHFPAFAKEAVEILVSRDIVGIAIDTLSPDCLDLEYPVHQTLLQKAKYIIENLANCEKVPPKGSYIIALPLCALDATEAPIRVIACIPKKT